MASAGSLVLDVVKCLAAPIGRPFKYLYNYNTNFKNLEKEVTKLKNTRDEVQVKVTGAERNMEEIKQNVKDWQTKVNNTITEAERLIEEKEENPRCFKGLRPNCITCYKHSKKASELMEDKIDPLLQQEEKFDRVSYPTIHKEIWLRPDEDYLAFKSRNSTEKNVWEALKDEKIYMMGVYGMGGLGKTTLVQEIGRKAAKDKLFDEIVFVEVTETPDTKKIQTVIANKLSLKFKDAMEDESQRASKLYSRMEKRNILLIIDNIWGELDLKIVGIPSLADRGRNKILMTTRNVDVLEKMGSTKNLGMGILNEEEAWRLFQKMAGGGEIPTCELNSLPRKVCKECGGLPIVICTIAKALRKKRRPSDWTFALQELKAPSPAKFIGLLEKEYTKIALSYKYLRDDELKKTFLLSSLMENNTSISDFFIHVVGLDILEGPNLKMKEARDRLDTLVCDLKDSCLLTDGFTSEQFAMHDVVRSIAVTISYMDHHIFTGRNDVEREWKDKDKLKKCTKISLIDSSIINELWPDDLDCPNLEYFYMATMWGSCSSFEIPEDFFKVMPKLKVLNLFAMQQSMLPSSLDLLTNLRTLCLNDSEIEDIAIIGKLKKLKVLTLKNSPINELPTELGQLTQLRSLDLSNCMQLEVIAPNVISKLLQLEEFHVKGCPIEWKDEVLEELTLLSHLASLELDIKDSKMLPKDFFSKELERYKISIGNWLFKRYIEDNEDKGLRIFELKLNSTISLEELRGIRNVELLRIADFSYVENSFNDFVTLTPLLNEKV
ncbi:hypothetical protein Pint_21721 [Pistacia integerrima]|uniref:Uncharacterized protein n=1 Tax=Pistacia integerrima TaxID=434235 RepID=A0ACC0XBE7_9ROSI|nr:hypothetical protein Pint_21721 [Pistacia integerrima]